MQYSTTHTHATAPGTEYGAVDYTDDTEPIQTLPYSEWWPRFYQTQSLDELRRLYRQAPPQAIEGYEGQYIRGVFEAASAHQEGDIFEGPGMPSALADRAGSGVCQWLDTLRAAQSWHRHDLSWLLDLQACAPDGVLGYPEYRWLQGYVGQLLDIYMG